MRKSIRLSASQTASLARLKAPSGVRLLQS